jgi:hypothetical protein
MCSLCQFIFEKSVIFDVQHGPSRLTRIIYSTYRQVCNVQSRHMSLIILQSVKTLHKITIEQVVAYVENLVSCGEQHAAAAGNSLRTCYIVNF